MRFFIEYKLGSAVFDFDDMVVYTNGGYFRLYFCKAQQELQRVGHKQFVCLSPNITKAYLDYQIEKILLEGENE